MSLNIRYASKGEVIDKERATRSYYSRHELQARASRGKGKGVEIFNENIINFQIVK